MIKAKAVKAKTTEKLEEIEWIRAICCLLVITIHVTAEFWTSFTYESIQYKLNILLNTLSQFAVPCFIFISGFVLYYVYYSREYSYLDFYKRRIRKIAIPYLVWSGIYILINYLIHGVPIDIVSIIKNLILGRASSHLYFIPLIIQFYFIFPFLLKFYQKLNNRVLTMSIFLASNVAFTLYIKMPFKDRFFMNYLLYFGLGFLLADLKIKGFVSNVASRTVLFSLYLLFISYYFVDRYRAIANLEFICKKLYMYAWRVFSLISIISIYALANILKVRKPNWIDNMVIRSLSRHSFTIYLCHMFFIKLLMSSKGFNKLENFSMTLAFAFELFAVICVSWVFSVVLDKLRNMRPLLFKYL